ncbi:MAG: RsmB/NOP family class I SAM-dependent RNA methyltransferase [Actinomycetota bacterium]
MASSVPRTAKWRQFLDRTSAATGLRAEELVDRLQGARASSARANRLHPDGRDAIVDRLLGEWPALEPVHGDPDSFLCSDAAPYTELIDLADEGLVYLQNASSLLPVMALDPQPGERILDMAAAPGGKAFNIAARMGNEGELWLNDAARPRLEKMQRLAGTYHVEVHAFLEHKAQYLDKEITDTRFDRILVDAQCTGEGRFDLRRRNALQHWNLSRIETYTHLQTKMLEVAYRLLRPGGRIVYSTCTIAPEENEAPIHRILGRHDDLDVEALPPSPNDADLIPGLKSWDGHRFDARIQRTGRVLPGARFEAFYVASLLKR